MYPALHLVLIAEFNIARQDISVSNEVQDSFSMNNTLSTFGVSLYFPLQNNCQVLYLLPHSSTLFTSNQWRNRRMK